MCVYLQSSVEALTFPWSRSAVTRVHSEGRHTAGELQGKTVRVKFNILKFNEGSQGSTEPQ